MSQSVRYQVFVSSTFTDLKEERAEVIQALWELDCIPTGMEAFVATNEEQWEVIRKVIEECDYYVLIIGGRYGSVTGDGISYTEKEYNYAKSLGIPVLCFVHADPDNIPVGKSEADGTGKARLDAFRARVMKDHPVKRWTNPYELGGHVSRSVSREIRVSPRPGWVRNTGSSNLELLEQINALTKDNNLLAEKIRGTQSNFGINLDELQSGGDPITLTGTATVFVKGGSKYDTVTINWSAITTWDDIFRDVGTMLINEATETEISRKLSDFVFVSDLDWKTWELRYQALTSESFADVIIQLRALGLVDKGMKKRTVSDKGSYWGITEKGERYLTGLMAKRKERSMPLAADDEAPRAMPLADLAVK